MTAALSKGDETSPQMSGLEPASGRKIPLWAQVLGLVVLFFAVKSTPSLPYAGQASMLIGLIAATLVLRHNGETWYDLGLRFPTSWGGFAKGAVLTVLILIGVSAANWVLLTTLPLLLGEAAERTFFEVSDLTTYLTFMGLVWTTNAFGEEMLFRGFLMSRLSAMMGGTRFAWIVAAFAQAIIFGIGHAYQGIGGIVTTGVIGLVFGLFYLVGRRNLLPLIVAHGIINTFGITAIYLATIGVIDVPGLG